MRHSIPVLLPMGGCPYSRGAPEFSGVGTRAPDTDSHLALPGESEVHDLEVRLRFDAIETREDTADPDGDSVGGCIDGVSQDLRSIPGGFDTWTREVTPSFAGRPSGTGTDPQDLDIERLDGGASLEASNGAAVPDRISFSMPSVPGQRYTGRVHP